MVNTGTTDGLRGQYRLLTLPTEARDVGVDIVTLMGPRPERRTLEVLQCALIGTITYITGDVALVLGTGVVLDRIIDRRLLALETIHEGRVGLTPIVGISSNYAQFHSP